MPVRLVTMHTPRGPRIGVWQPGQGDEGGDVIDLAALAGYLGLRSSPTSLDGLVAASATGLDTVAELIAAEPRSLGEPPELPLLAERSTAAGPAGQAGGPRPWRTPYASAPLAVPLMPPGILCSGEKPPRHEEPRDEPAFFVKAPLAVASHGATVVIDRRVVGKLGVRVALGVVIGTPGRNIPAAQALDHVFGYTVVLDMSAHDREHDLVRGKNFDGSCPVGPAVVTADEVPGPQALRVRGYVDGEARQDSTAADMTWPVAELIAYFSRFFTLAPGTLIVAGAPGGGEAPYISDGQRVTGQIDGIGSLTVTVRDLSP